MKIGKFRFILVLVVAVLVGYAIGVTKISLAWKNYQPHVAFSSKEPPPSLMNADFGPFWTVLAKLESNYYDKQAIDAQKILNGAISGMVESLDDPYTVYLPPAQNDDFKNGLAGKFEGIGAELGLKNKQIIIVAPLDGSPAKKAGIKAGDAILKVDEEPTVGWSLNKAVEKIRGPKGTKVTLTVVHKSAEKAVPITIVRDTITVKSLSSWTKQIKEIEEIDINKSPLSSKAEQKVTYIRLSQFGDSTNKEWSDQAVHISQQLKEDPSIKGIIFDLRNNPGGYLGDAVMVASEFIKEGTGVIQEDKNKEQQAYAVTGRGLLTDVPVIVLINRGSASASEIVAGALRDHERAILVGETSFGKGTIQQAEDLGEGAGIHVTIAKWLTPKGTWVHQKGLIPDIVVPNDENGETHDVQLERAIEELVK